MKSGNLVGEKSCLLGCDAVSAAIHSLFESSLLTMEFLKSSAKMKMKVIFKCSLLLRCVIVSILF